MEAVAEKVVSEIPEGLSIADERDSDAVVSEIPKGLSTADEREADGVVSEVSERVSKADEREAALLKCFESNRERFVSSFSGKCVQADIRVQDAQDILQEAFLRATKSIHRFNGRAKLFNGRAKLSTWFYAIANNVFCDFVRKKKRERKKQSKSARDIPRLRGIIVRSGEDDQEFNIDIVSPEIAVPDAVANSEILAEVRSAFSELIPIKRAIILLVLEGLSYKNIAERLDIPVGSVGSGIFYARDKLRKILESRGIHSETIAS